LIASRAARALVLLDPGQQLAGADLGTHADLD
jgi:hypothetical protein